MPRSRRRTSPARGVANAIELRLGPAIETLPQLVAEGCGPFDFVFIDADKPSAPEYFTWALKLTRPGSVIIIDNVIRNGEVHNADSTDPNVLGVRRLNELVSAEPRVTATAIQTVGVKGYDGFVISVVD
jgi:predicted O-methyltransferase YrrM